MKKSRRRDRNTIKGIDRISSLPDEVLIRILSFVRTTQAVRTCILSKRWRNIWASVPVLNLNFDDYWIEEIIEEPGQYNDLVDEFVICWLDNREPVPLDLFLYHDTYNQLRDELHWLDHVEPTLPKAISVVVYSLFGFDSMLSSTSLKHLELHLIKYGHRAHLPELHLPSLKTLSVSSNYYSLLIDNDSLDCPVLEKIVIFYCAIHISEISSSVLKEIEIYNTVHDDDDLLHISCPGLISLDILNTRISLENMALPSLVNANIISDGCDMKLATFSNTTCLKLITDDRDTMEQLEKDISTCRTFNNLKRLEIGKWDMWNDFDLVACFLKNSPLLEKLTLHLAQVDPMLWALFPEHSSHEEPKDVTIQLEYIEMVKIIKYVPGNFPNELPDELIDWLVKRVHAHVKIIGEIIIE